MSEECATPNFEKAMAMLSLGVPPVCIDGKPLKPGGCWELRLVSSKELEENGWKTIQDAEEAGFEGRISYGFGPHPERKHIIEGFDEATKIAHQNGSMDLPDIIEIEDASGKKTQHRASKIMAMAIAFAFRNAEKFWPRRTEVHAKLLLEKDDGEVEVIDRRAE